LIEEYSGYLLGFTGTPSIVFADPSHSRENCFAAIDVFYGGLSEEEVHVVLQTK
jgi:hypothetical protein